MQYMFPSISGRYLLIWYVLTPRHGPGPCVFTRLRKQGVATAKNQDNEVLVLVNWGRFSGPATGTDSLEAPTIYKAYLLGLWFREYP